MQLQGAEKYGLSLLPRVFPIPLRDLIPPKLPSHLAGDPTDILGLVIRPAKLGNRAIFLPKQSAATAIQRALLVHLCPESIHIKSKILKILNRINYNFWSVAFNVSSKLRQE